MSRCSFLLLRKVFRDFRIPEIRTWAGTKVWSLRPGDSAFKDMYWFRAGLHMDIHLFVLYLGAVR